MGITLLGGGLAGCSQEPNNALSTNTSTSRKSQTDSSQTKTTASANKSPSKQQNPTPPTPTEVHSFNTPAPSKCDPYKPPSPTPTSEGLEPRSYPVYPSDISEVAAKDYATEYEAAYQHNSFISEEFIYGTDEITILRHVPEWTISDRSKGYILGVSGEIKTADTEQPEGSTDSQAAYLDSPFSAWYYVTDRFALRNEVEDLDATQSPNLQYATTIYCDKA